MSYQRSFQYLVSDVTLLTLPSCMYRCTSSYQARSVSAQHFFNFVIKYIRNERTNVINFSAGHLFRFCCKIKLPSKLV